MEFGNKSELDLEWIRLEEKNFRKELDRIREVFVSGVGSDRRDFQKYRIEKA